MAALNNLALVQIKARKFGPARNSLTLAAGNGDRPREVDQNIGRFLHQASVFKLKKDEITNVTNLNAKSNGFKDTQGWLYMPVAQDPKSLNEYKAFTADGTLEDCSCSHCNGVGHLKCPRCSGTGSKVEETTTTNTYRSLNGTSTLSSQNSRLVSCPACGGRQRIDCGFCTNGRDPHLHR